MVVSSMRRQDTAVYSTVRAEYDALTKAIGMVDRSHLGRLKVSGADAIDLLDRLSTNKLIDMVVGEIEGTVMTTNKGRIIDLLFVVRRDDHLLVITGPDTRQRVAEWIDFYTFVEDVVVEDVSEETAMLTVAGRKVAEVLPQLFRSGIVRFSVYHGLRHRGSCPSHRNGGYRRVRLYSTGG